MCGPHMAPVSVGVCIGRTQGSRFDRRLSHKPNRLYEFDNGCLCRPRDSGSGGQSASSAAEKAHRRIGILSQTHKKVRPAMVCATASDRCESGVLALACVTLGSKRCRDTTCDRSALADGRVRGSPQLTIGRTVAAPAFAHERSWFAGGLDACFAARAALGGHYRFESANGESGHVVGRLVERRSSSPAEDISGCSSRSMAVVSWLPCGFQRASGPRPHWL